MSSRYLLADAVDVSVVSSTAVPSEIKNDLAAYARVTDMSEKAVLETCFATAMDWAQEQGVYVLTTTLLTYIDSENLTLDIAMRGGPFIAVTKVEELIGSTWTLVPVTGYQVMKTDYVTSVRREWQSTVRRITHTTGFGTTKASVPPNVLMNLYSYAIQLYTYREGEMSAPIPLRSAIERYVQSTW